MLLARVQTTQNYRIAWMLLKAFQSLFKISQQILYGVKIRCIYGQGVLSVLCTCSLNQTRMKAAHRTSLMSSQKIVWGDHNIFTNKVLNEGQHLTSKNAEIYNLVSVNRQRNQWVITQYNKPLKTIREPPPVDIQILYTASKMLHVAVGVLETSVSLGKGQIGDSQENTVRLLQLLSMFGVF